MSFTGIVHAAVWKELASETHAEARHAMTGVASRADPWAAASVRAIEGSVYPGAHRLRVGRWRILFIVLPDEGHVVFTTAFLKKRASDYRAALARHDARVKGYE